MHNRFKLRLGDPFLEEMLSYTLKDPDHDIINSLSTNKMQKVTKKCESSSVFADALSRILVNCFGLILLSLGVISGSLGGVIGTLTGVSISGYYLGSLGAFIGFGIGSCPTSGAAGAMGGLSGGLLGGYIGTAVHSYFISSRIGLLYGLLAGGTSGGVIGAIISLFFAAITTL